MMHIQLLNIYMIMDHSLFYHRYFLIIVIVTKFFGVLELLCCSEIFLIF